MNDFTHHPHPHPHPPHMTSSLSTISLKEAHARFADALRKDLSLMVQPHPITVQLLTWPELIDYLVEHNTRNRTIKDRQLGHLVDLMQSGRWYCTGQGLSVDTQGETIDGGNRSTAIKKAGYPTLRINLTLGVDRKALAVIDSHAKRTSSDVLGLMLDQKVSNWVAATARLLVLFAYNSLQNCAFKPSAHQMALVISLLREEIELFQPLLSVDHRKWSAARIAAWLVYAKVNTAFAADFAKQVHTGAALEKGSPALRLRTDIFKPQSGGGVMQTEGFYATLNILRAAYEGRSVTKLYVSTELTPNESAFATWLRQELENQ